jgi:hypothetical protein
VIADDICTDFYQVILSSIKPELKAKIHTLMLQEETSQVNRLFESLMRQSLMLEWAIHQGMHITGSQTPYEFLKRTMQYNTTEISSRLTQDVLLLCAQKDHYIPLRQFFEQSQTLTEVRSLTTRLFTDKEHAQNHCHIGNIGLSIDVMINWIQQMQE